MRQKILILYHSGAGSTKTIADVYSILLKEYQTDILPVSLSFDYTLIGRYDLLVFCFPCYHCDVSKLMKEFLERMPEQPQPTKAFAFLTYGLYAGNAIRNFIKKCRSKKIHVENYADYRAPATDGTLLLPSFRFMYRYEKNVSGNILKDIEKIKKILSGERSTRKLPRFKLYTLLNYPNEILGKKSKPRIKVRKEVCTNCHLCVNRCPRGCWTAGTSYPVFDPVACDSYYKCIHHCPREALVFSEKTIRKKKLNPAFYKEWKEKILEGRRKKKKNLFQ